MTSNQIAYWNWAETVRYNKARESIDRKNAKSNRISALASQKSAEAAWKNAETNAYSASFAPIHAQAALLGAQSGYYSASLNYNLGMVNSDRNYELTSQYNANQYQLGLEKLRQQESQYQQSYGLESTKTKSTTILDWFKFLGGALGLGVYSQAKKK